MKYCMYCGTQLPDAAAFCAKCGKPQGKTEGTPAPEQVRPQTPPAPSHQPAPRQSAHGSQPQSANPSNISTPGVGSEQPPYVKPPKDVDLMQYYKSKQVITIYNAKLFDNPQNMAGSDISLDLFPACLRITTTSFILVGTYITKRALMFDTIRTVTMRTESALFGARTVMDLTFTNPEAQPIRITSKSKHFPELIRRLAEYAGTTVIQG